VDPADVLRVAAALPDTIIVLDEAYLDFSDTPSLAAEAAVRPNLVVLKTLSKALWSRRSARRLRDRQSGFGCHRLARLAALPAAEPFDRSRLSALAPSRRPIHRERIARIKADRERLAGLFASSPIVRKVRSGGGNFLFSKWRTRKACRRN
jgi:histidinol-phosphate/aromatic aminotransferase/cobyric acid decarboxylase-like protein